MLRELVLRFFYQVVMGIQFTQMKYALQKGREGQVMSGVLGRFFFQDQKRGDFYGMEEDTRTVNKIH